MGRQILFLSDAEREAKKRARSIRSRDRYRESLGRPVAVYRPRGLPKPPPSPPKSYEAASRRNPCLPIRRVLHALATERQLSRARQKDAALRLSPEAVAKRQTRVGLAAERRAAQEVIRLGAIARAVKRRAAPRNAPLERQIAKLREVQLAWRTSDPRAYFAYRRGCIEKTKAKKRLAKKAESKRRGFLATPPWADLDAIRQIYARCAKRAKETGIALHVDHFVPLNGRNVCGLHCEANLVVIPADANVAKGNSWDWETQMPIVPGFEPRYWAFAEVLC